MIAFSQIRVNAAGIISCLLVPVCPKTVWDTQLTIFIGVTAVFALCPTFFTKSTPHCVANP